MANRDQYALDAKVAQLKAQVDEVQEKLKNRNDFYDTTYEFDYPSHVPSKRAANSKGVR